MEPSFFNKLWNNKVVQGIVSWTPFALVLSIVVYQGRGETVQEAKQSAVVSSVKRVGKVLLSTITLGIPAIIKLVRDPFVTEVQAQEQINGAVDYRFRQNAHASVVAEVAKHMDDLSETLGEGQKKVIEDSFKSYREEQQQRDEHLVNLAVKRIQDGLNDGQIRVSEKALTRHDPT